MDTPTFVDGIGRRLRTVDPAGEEVEALRLCRELSEAPSTEPALIERAGRLASFTHASFSQVRRVERFRGALGGLTVVSAPVPGTRLSELLTFAQRKWVAPDFDAALYILEQVAAAMTALHRHSRDLSHGTLGPERIVIRPDGHPVIVEHLLAPAMGQLGMPRAALWTQFRVPAPAVAGSARLDQLTDIMQLGVLALALILGRPIRREEFPQKLQELLTEASTPGVLGPRPAIARSLHGWILRTLQFESRAAFRTMGDAAAALDALVAEQPRHRISPAAAVAYAAACMAPGEGARPQPRPVASPVPIVLRDNEPAKTEPDRADTTRVSRPPRPEPAPVRRRDERSRPDEQRHDTHHSFVVRAVTRAVRRSIQQVSRLDWSSARRGIKVALVSLGLVALFGVTYLGARGYLGLPGLIGGRGTLVVESQPSGADLYVDGFPSGQTPTTLQLRAGEHTLALRAGKRTTLVPVVVVSGARRVERVEIRQRRATPARPPASAGAGQAALPAAATAPSSPVTGK